MAFVTKDFVVDKMEEKKLPYYLIRDTDGSILDRNDQEGDEPTSKTAAEALSAALEELDGTFVRVSLSSKTGKDKSTGGNTRACSFEYKVKLNSERSKSGVGTFDGAGGSRRVEELLREIHEQKLINEGLKADQRYRELEKKIDEMGKESPVEKFLPAILTGMGWMPKAEAPQAINGLPDTETASPETKKTAPANDIKENLKRLVKVDPQFPAHLKMLADLAEKNSLIYFGAVEQLKKQV